MYHWFHWLTCRHRQPGKPPSCRCRRPARSAARTCACPWRPTSCTPPATPCATCAWTAACLLMCCRAGSARSVTPVGRLPRCATCRCAHTLRLVLGSSCILIQPEKVGTGANPPEGTISYRSRSINDLSNGTPAPSQARKICLCIYPVVSLRS